jgi:hypothetical protein
MRASALRLPVWFLLVLSASLVAGCPGAEPTPGECRSDHDCTSTQHCDPAPASLPPGTLGQCESGARCASNADCGSNYYHCGAEGFCIIGAPCATPGQVCASGSQETTYCVADDDTPHCVESVPTEFCRGLSPALASSNGSCVPEDACYTDANCRPGEFCLDAQCSASAGCTADAECGDGYACYRGQCLVRCDGGQPCADVTTCTVGVCQWLVDVSDQPCGPHQLYYWGHCRAICNANADCPLGFYCDGGLCRLDDRPALERPAPACTADANCAQGSRCVVGACRATCPGGTDLECQQRDVAFTHCDAEHVCRP